MKIEVGSKWELISLKGLTVKIKAVIDDIVVVVIGYYGELNEEYFGYARKEFVSLFKPIKPKYEWHKDTCFKTYKNQNNIDAELYNCFASYISDGVSLSSTREDLIKDYEILKNYYLYREKFDNVGLDWKNEKKAKYCVVYNHYGKEYTFIEVWKIEITNGLYFSAKEHAQNFIELLKENVNE